MKLTDLEKAMLDGAHGKGVQKAMELNLRYAEALGAEEFVEVASAGGYLIDRNMCPRKPRAGHPVSGDAQHTLS